MNITVTAERPENDKVVATITVPAAAYTQDPATGVWSAEPGEAVLVVTGTIQTN